MVYAAPYIDATKHIGTLTWRPYLKADWSDARNDSLFMRVLRLRQIGKYNAKLRAEGSR